MKRRILSFLFAVCLVMTVVPSVLSMAITAPVIPDLDGFLCSFNLEAPKEVAKSSSFNLKLTLGGLKGDALDGIYGMDFTLLYDSDILEAASVTTTRNGEASKLDSAVSNGKITFFADWFSEPVKNDGELVITVRFNALENSAGKTSDFYIKNTNAVYGASYSGINQKLATVKFVESLLSTTEISGIKYTFDKTASTTSIVSVSNAIPADFTLPNSIEFEGKTYTVTGVLSGAFKGVSLKKIHIGCGVKTIADDAFSDNSVVIYGCRYSAAFAFAEKNKLTFVDDPTLYDVKIKTAPTCGTKGVNEYTCKHCHNSFELSDIPATNQHTFGDWVVVTPATETATGTEERVCSVCKTKETRTIPIKIHCDHDATKKEITTPASCTAEGVLSTVCTVCGEVLDTEAIPATGHSFSDWVVTVQPTETTKGEEQRTCSVCNTVEKREVDVIVKECQHTHTTNKHKDSTCTSNGYDRTVCVDCGKIISSTTIKAAHTPGSLEVKNATCTEDGYEKQACTVCGEYLVNKAITAFGHHYNDWETVVTATTDSEGVQKHTCVTCGNVEIQTVPAIEIPDESSTEESAPPSETSDDPNSAVISTPSLDDSSAAPSQSSNKTIFFIIGGVVILLTVGYIVMMALNKKKNY